MVTYFQSIKGRWGKLRPMPCWRCPLTFWPALYYRLKDSYMYLSVQKIFLRQQGCRIVKVNILKVFQINTVHRTTYIHNINNTQRKYKHNYFLFYPRTVSMSNVEILSDTEKIHLPNDWVEEVSWSCGSSEKLICEIFQSKSFGLCQNITNTCRLWLHHPAGQWTKTCAGPHKNV